MRVTQSMLSNNLLRNLSTSYSKIGNLNEQVMTGKKFNKPSDNPVGMMRSLGYRTDIAHIEQFQQNIGEVRNWVDSTDDALDQSVKALQKIRELTVQVSNGTLESSQREYIATEIEELKKHLIDLGDTEVGGKYIFNGTKTNLPPSDTNFANATGKIELEVFSNIYLQVNTEGQLLFEDFTKSDGVIGKLLTDIVDPNVDSETLSAHLGSLDAKINDFLKERSNIGVRQNRVDLMEERLMSQEVSATRILSDNEDVDLERAIIDLTMQESVHRAALGVGSKIIQPTLMDFLR